MMNYYAGLKRVMKERPILTILTLGGAGCVGGGFFLSFIPALSGYAPLASFFGAFLSFLCALLAVMPQQALAQAPTEMTNAVKFQRANRPVEKDWSYPRTKALLAAMKFSPHRWTFDATPWGAEVITVKNAKSVPKVCGVNAFFTN